MAIQHKVHYLPLLTHKEKKDGRGGHVNTMRGQVGDDITAIAVLKADSQMDGPSGGRASLDTGAIKNINTKSSNINKHEHRCTHLQVNVLHMHTLTHAMKCS